jgi:hypothetical protein
MKHERHLTTIVLFAMLLSVGALAQTDDNVSLGELARSLRREKLAAAETVIDNDNLSRVMEEAETRKFKESLSFSFDRSGRDFRISSPDVTCSLAFNAKTTALVAEPIRPSDMPQSEMAKLDGPATMDGDTLQISVHNATAWDVREITVGLTIIHREDENAASFDTSKLLPAVVEETAPAEKYPVLTLLLHLRGTAAPGSTTAFRAKLTASIGQDQEWHWAIVQAKGLPPATVASANGY